VSLDIERRTETPTGLTGVVTDVRQVAVTWPAVGSGSGGRARRAARPLHLAEGHEPADPAV